MPTQLVRSIFVLQSVFGWRAESPFDFGGSAIFPPEDSVSRMHFLVYSIVLWIELVVLGALLLGEWINEIVGQSLNPGSAIW